MNTVSTGSVSITQCYCVDGTAQDNWQNDGSGVCGKCGVGLLAGHGTVNLVTGSVLLKDGRQVCNPCRTGQYFHPGAFIADANIREVWLSNRNCEYDKGRRKDTSVYTGVDNEHIGDFDQGTVVWTGGFVYIDNDPKPISLPCEKGTYRQQENPTWPPHFWCFSCGNWATTLVQGAISHKQCVSVKDGPNIYPAGSEWKPEGRCHKCMDGWYKQLPGNGACAQCPANMATDPSSDWHTECFPGKGRTRNLSPNGRYSHQKPISRNAFYSEGYFDAVECPISTLKDTVGHFVCRPCGYDRTTLYTGNQFDSQCICQSGFGWDTVLYRCVLCEQNAAAGPTGSVSVVGTYTAKNGSQVCKPRCVLNEIIISNNVTQDMQCVCPRQYGRPGPSGQHLQACVRCLSGYFKDEYNNDACFACKLPKSSPAKTIADALCDDSTQCAPGWELREGETFCSECDIGYFKNSSGNHLCTSCNAYLEDVLYANDVSRDSDDFKIPGYDNSYTLDSGFGLERVI